MYLCSGPRSFLLAIAKVEFIPPSDLVFTCVTVPAMLSSSHSVASPLLPVSFPGQLRRRPTLPVPRPAPPPWPISTKSLVFFTFKTNEWIVNQIAYFPGGPGGTKIPLTETLSVWPGLRSHYTITCFMNTCNQPSVYNCEVNLFSANAEN